MDSRNPNKKKKSKIQEPLSNVVEVTINCLNADCLISIFEYLPIKDKLNIELVCSRWNWVAKLSWSKVKAFKISFFDLLFKYCKIKESEPTEITNFVMNVLNRSGSYLNNILLGFPYQDELKYSIIISELPKLCNNITKLCLSEVDSNFLKETQSRTLLFNDENLKLIFEKNPNINSINLENLSIKGDCLLNLNGNLISECSFYNCKFIEQKYFHDFFLNLLNLNKLCLTNTINEISWMVNTLLMSDINNLFDIKIKISDAIITNEDNFLNFHNTIKSDLSTFLPKQKKLHKLKLSNLIIDLDFMKNVLTEELEELGLGDILVDEDKLLIKYFNKLKNLKAFKGNFYKMDNDLLQVLINNLTESLEKLEIFSYNFLLTDKPINFNKLVNLKSFSILCYNDRSNTGNLLKDLSQCKCLKHLVINNFVINDEALHCIGELKNLINLEFSRTDAKEKDFLYLIEKLINLQKLKIAFCKFKPENVITLASNIKTSRRDIHTLNIILFSSVSPDFLINKYDVLPLINAEFEYESFSNLCLD